MKNFYNDANTQAEMPFGIRKSAEEIHRHR